MSKILCFMPISLKPTNKVSTFPEGDTRNNHYINGFKEFFSYNNILKKHNITVIVFDNTIKSKDEIPEKILCEIPDNVIIKTDIVNVHGEKNKGGGLVEAWLHNIDTIKEYDYLIHFEPRQFLKSFTFIENFLDNTRNVFTYNNNPCTAKHFNTGLFTIQTNVLLKFISIYKPEFFSRTMQSIEYVLYNFFQENKIEYDTLDKMDLIWYPTLGMHRHY